jgi:transposase InsO family protein
LLISERRACTALGQHRSTQRKIPRGRDDEERLTADIVALAKQYGRYGYRKIAEFLRRAGWLVNDKRVERIWRREGLKVPAKQPKRARWDCQEFRAAVGHDGSKGAQQCRDARSHVFRTPFSINCWPALMPRRPLIPTGCSTT